MTTLLWLLVAFQIKHFICDFPLQSFPYMYKNKGTYGHLGGFLHAGVHAVGTTLIGWLFHFPLGLIELLVILDFVVHYHIDWAKMKLNAHYGWGPLTSEKFWILLGIDQLLHQLTYIWFLQIIMTYHF